MKFPFLSSLFVFIIWLAYEIRKHNRIEKKALDEFFSREAKANNTPAKPLDDLKLITIPLEDLPMDVLCDDETIAECISTVEYLSNEKIVNLTGFTNTDLKLKYGTTNITKLTSFDYNYTSLIQTLIKWKKRLLLKGEKESAIKVMEFEVSTGSDAKTSYMYLADYYKETDQPDKIKGLISKAESINTISRNNILEELNTYL